jgi:hypothetical protein
LLLPVAVEDRAGADNPVRFTDAFVDARDLAPARLGLARGRPVDAATECRGYPVQRVFISYVVISTYSFRRKPVIDWTPIGVNEKPVLGGKIVLPEYSAAIIGSSIVLRVCGGDSAGLSIGVTTIPFATPHAAAEWIEANRADLAYTSQLMQVWSEAPS